MSTAKEEVRVLLDKLPDDSSLAVLYRLLICVNTTEGE
jgi:hypothetical protein